MRRLVVIEQIFFPTNLLVIFALLLMFSPLALALSGWFVLGSIVSIFFYLSVLLGSGVDLNRKDFILIAFLSAFEFIVWLFSGQSGINLSYISLLVVISLIPFANFLFRRFGTDVIISIFLLIIMLHGVWGISQFILQEDLGFYLLGETRIDVEAQGIAKFDVGDGDKLIRAYGPYSHPNVYGAVMSIGLFLSLIMSNRIDRLRPYLLMIVSPVFFLGSTISFSRSVWLSVLIAMIALIWMKIIEPAGIRKYLLVLLILSALLLPLVAARISDSDDRALIERGNGYAWAISIINDQAAWKGVGIGNYPEALRSYLEGNLIVHDSWHIDYVHSVPLLLAAEWGLLSALMVGLIILWLLPSLSRRVCYGLALLLPLLFLDHYFLSQAYLIFFLALFVIMVRRVFQ